MSEIITSPVEDWLKPYMKKLSSTIDASMMVFHQKMNSYTRTFSRAFSSAITNFGPPETYNPTQVTVQNWIETQAIREFQELKKGYEHEPLNIFYDRINMAYQAYNEKNWYLPIFTFLSVQDGLMSILCEIRDVPKTSNRNYYTKDEKWDQLKLDFGDLKYIINDDLFINNLKAFYQHRNEIMHGGSKAFFDKNIAIISLLFLIFTHYIVIDANTETQNV